MSPMSLRVLLKAPFSPFSGYGNDGISLAMALERYGAEVFIEPTVVQPPIPARIAKLLTKPLEMPFDLVIQHVDPMQLGISHEARGAAPVTVGWSMWEYSNLDNMSDRSTLKRRLKNFDAVIGYDAVSSEAFRPYLPKGVVPITLQGGYWPEKWTPVERDWSGRFGFCMVGVLTDRKAPFMAIDAFKELKDEYPEEFEPAELHMKTSVPGLHSAMEEWCPKLRIHYATWTYEQLKKFYSMQHVLLSTSRGEGKNMPALEFMSTGGTVIATDWGGHGQWQGDWAYQLKYDLKPAYPNKPNCLNAWVDKDDLKAQMLFAFRNRAETKRKGDLAASVIPMMCSWDLVLDKLFQRLRETVPVKGEQLYNKAMMSKMEDGQW